VGGFSGKNKTGYMATLPHMHRLLDPELYDLAAILAASRKHLAGNELTKDARNRIEAVAQAIEQHLKEGGAAIRS
jgi:hypothetical protein